MKFLSSLFRFGKQPGDSLSESLDKFVPANELERELKALCKGKGDMSRFLDLLLRSKLYTPMRGDANDALGGKMDLIVSAWERQGQMILAFTSRARMNQKENPHLQNMRTAVLVDADWLLSRVPPELGLAINPGLAAAFYMPAGELARFKADLEKQAEESPPPQE